MRVPSTRRAALRRRLLAWYDAGHRALPWRFPQRRADPYRVWLAEVMLQQTQVATVVPYFERFVARFPTLEALAVAREEEVLALWSGLGYYARARNLRAAAREALRRHAGLPASLAALHALPGFGPYTAGAVASIAFAIPAPVVDGNVARVLARLFLLEGDPALPRMRRALWSLAGALVPGAERVRETGGSRRGAASKERPGDFNQALMELGATLCVKPVPACGACPVASLCEARRAGREGAVPPARTRPRRLRIELACAVVRRDAALLVRRRPGRGLFGGLWELPAAEVTSGGEPRAALQAALAAAGIRAAPGRELAAVSQVLTHRDLSLRAFDCAGATVSRSGRARRPGGLLKWADADELARLAMASATRKLLAALPRPML